MNKRQIFMLTILIFIAIRFLFISIDPPTWLTGSRGPFADEGYKTYEARNMHLFGELDPHPEDSYDGWYEISPVSYHMFLGMFNMFGAGYVQARMINILLSIFCIYLLYIIVAKAYDKDVAKMAAVLLGTNFIFLVYSKIALLEVPLTLFLLLSILFWQKSYEHRWMIIFSLASFIAAYFTKPIAIFFAPAILFMVIHSNKDILMKRPYMIGSALGIIILSILTYLLLPEVIEKLISLIASRSPDSLTDLIIRAKGLMREKFFLYNIILTLGFFFYIVLFFSSKRKPLDIVAFIWSIFLIVLLALQDYRPIRYFVPLTPAFCLLVSVVISEKKRIAEFFKKKSPIRDVFMFVLIYLMLAASYYPLKILFPILEDHKILFLLSDIAVAFVVMMFLGERFNGVVANVFKLKRFMAIVLFVYLMISIVPSIAWFGAPNFQMIESSKDFRDTVPKDANVLGINWAQALCMESEHRCYKVSGTFNEADEAFKELDIDYFITDDLSKYNYPAEFLKNPRFEQSLTLVKTYRIARWEIFIYEFDKEVFYVDS